MMHRGKVEKLHGESACSLRSQNPTATDSNGIFTNFRKIRNTPCYISAICNHITTKKSAKQLGKTISNKS